MEGAKPDRRPEKTPKIRTEEAKTGAGGARWGMLKSLWKILEEFVTKWKIILNFATKA